MKINGQTKNPDHKRSDNDFYATPPQFVEGLLKWEDFCPKMWEPACGDGTFANVLRAHGYDVYCSDINPRNNSGEQGDFFELGARGADIATNPPFKILTRFVLHGLQVMERKLALVFPMYGLGGDKRRIEIWHPYPPKHILINPARLTIDGEVSQFNHIWVIWDKLYSGPTLTDWMDPIQ